MSETEAKVTSEPAQALVGIGVLDGNGNELHARQRVRIAGSDGGPGTVHGKTPSGSVCVECDDGSLVWQMGAYLFPLAPSDVAPPAEPATVDEAGRA